MAAGERRGDLASCFARLNLFDISLAGDLSRLVRAATPERGTRGSTLPGHNRQAGCARLSSWISLLNVGLAPLCCPLVNLFD